MTDISDINLGVDEQPSEFSKKGGVLEERRLGIEDDFHRALVRIEKQKVKLRWAVCVVALLVVIGLAGLEWLILCHIMFSYKEPSDLFVVLAVSPIAAVTAILIAMSVGVFSGYRGNELDGMAGPASKFVGGNGSSS